MKKVFLILMISFKINAEPLTIPTDIIYEAIGNAFKAAADGVATTARYATDNQTDDEKCNNQYWKHTQEHSKEYWKLYNENSEIKRTLNVHKINYTPLIKQNTSNIIIDQAEIRKLACSEKDYNVLIENKKNITLMRNENKILKEMLTLNQIELNNSGYFEKEKKVKDKKKLLIEVSN